MDMQKKMLNQNFQTIKDVAKIKEKQPEFVETIQENSFTVVQTFQNADIFKILNNIDF